MSDFGDRLRKLRKEADITQEQLAVQLGVVGSAVGKYERTPNSYPSIEILIKIADFFNVSTDYLLRGIKTVPTIENNINGSLSNSPFIQANQGGVVFNSESGKSLTPEAVELLNIYENLSGRNRLKLLNFAVDLEGSKE
ncbi:MAG: helix-turn-helix transcriptional regulator [Oscillospiraceae bacterium]|nr:helix-turn-helix transcriptional regulator [Oscillospiraceae bacterium]